MKKLRLSYTLLNLFRMGRVDDAIIYYFKLAKITSPAMEEGKKWDDLVNQYALENKALPLEFGGEKLINPQTQVKWETSYNELFDLVGVADIIDNNTLYEIKTGLSKDSSDYASDFQVGIYLLLAKLLNIPIEKAWILHYNQHEKILDKSLVWNTKEEIDRASNFIDTLGPEIYAYFEQNNLFEKVIDNH